MIVCTCRCISSKDYSNEEALKARILQNDFKCGLCQLQYLKDNYNIPYSDANIYFKMHE